jgi:hypothetical protein
LDLVTIFVREFGNFETTYFTPTFFDMIEICKHEKAVSAGNASLVIIVDEIN